MITSGDLTVTLVDVSTVMLPSFNNSTLSPLGCFVYTEQGKEETLSESNLIAHQTAVSVSASSLSIVVLFGKMVLRDSPLSSFFSFLLNKFVKKSVIANGIVFGISQLYDNKLALLCNYFAFIPIFILRRFLGVLMAFLPAGLSLLQKVEKIKQAQIP
jgi:hypothetical protein